MRRRWLPLFCLPLVVGCAHLRSSETVCPEYRDLRCLTAPECSMDKARGCQVCQCEATPTVGSMPSGVAPDRRTP